MADEQFGSKRVQEPESCGEDGFQDDYGKSYGYGIDTGQASVEVAGNALKYVIVAPTNFYDDGRSMYWMGGLEANVADWNWVHDKGKAHFFSSLADAQSKAFDIATKSPRYFGHVSVEAAYDDFDR